eukprot:scaffold4409_cov369-Prasinococcus_capsulatus_cf.AAC.34
MHLTALSCARNEYLLETEALPRGLVRDPTTRIDEAPFQASNLMLPRTVATAAASRLGNSRAAMGHP